MFYLAEDIVKPTLSQAAPIFAKATPPGTAALQLYRVSGAGILSALWPYIRTPKGLGLSLPVHQKTPWCRYVTLLDVSGGVLDDILLTCFWAPHSFTGEESAELSLHGNPLLGVQLEQLLIQIGMRLAKPGEFTFRAVLNGKTDLVQAEALHDLIHADHIAWVQWIKKEKNQPVLSGVITKIHSVLEGVMAYFEAHIDFAEDEVGLYQTDASAATIQTVYDDLEKLKASYNQGLKLRQGLKVALVGAPNAGKSTLFNALLGKKRALVTAIAGTTRDVLEEGLLLGDCAFVLWDTAGLRDHAGDEVEQLGIELSKERLQEADVVAWVWDGATDETQAWQQFSQATSLLEVPRIWVCTKSDLTIPTVTLAREAHIPVCLVSQENTSELQEQLKHIYKQCWQQMQGHTQPVLFSARQQTAVSQAQEHLQQALQLIQGSQTPEKIAHWLWQAAHTLESILGHKIHHEEILDQVFSRFCIGK